MTLSRRKTIVLLMLAGFVFLMVWRIFQWAGSEQGSGGREKDRIPVPVAVAEIKKGPITLTRTFSGTLEAQAAFAVAPKVSGRVNRLYVGISDRVSKGQVVAELDNDEYVQEKAQARADLAVAKANLMEAENALIIADRELARIKTLSSRGIKSESQLDAAKTDQLAKKARLEVARAQGVRAEAALETANIRLGYTKVTIDWSGDDADRVVAERFVDEGDMVSTTTPMMSIVKLHPIVGVIYITEKDYSRLSTDQRVQIVTDAFPEMQFQGSIRRIAPVFRRETRQARVEMVIDNPDQQLKPGMFIRVTIILGHIVDAILIPEQAITKRGDHAGVFIVNRQDNTVQWQPVTPGIMQDGVVQVEDVQAGGFVVTLGQQLLDHGSTVNVSETRASGE